ncbi:MAG: hypothetical protein HY690_07600 [Chloroflexi bacterium]|nr:hypothetical protein [Chloroflexota bacterium]
MISRNDALPAEQSARYYIDASWFEENGLSFPDILRVRMCESCQTKPMGEIEEAPPPAELPARSRRQAQLYSGRLAAFQASKANRGDPVKTIRDCCSKRKNFIQPEMPTMEAIFRVCLANGNQPITLEHVREQLAEWCPGGGCQWLTLPIETLARLVQNDRYYGIRPLGGVLAGAR